MAAEGSSAELGSGREASQVGPTLGFTSRDDPFSGDRWTGDEMSESAGNLQTGERTPEQEAVDLLIKMVMLLGVLGLGCCQVQTDLVKGQGLATVGLPKLSTRGHMTKGLRQWML